MSTPVVVLIAVAAASATIVILEWLRRLKKRRDARRKLADERELQRRVNAAPLRTMMPTLDGRNTFVTVRPTSGDRFPRKVLDELEEYIAQVPARRIHGKVRVEYRDDGWQPVRKGRGEPSEKRTAEDNTGG